MLKRLALLAVLLALICPIPVPGQSPDHGSKASHNPESKATNSQTPAKPTLTLVEKNCDSEQFKDDGDCKAAKDNERTVAVSKLPTANVAIQSNAKRDFFDWISYGATIVLVGVGLAGVIVGWRTLKWLRVQTLATQEAAKAALKQAQHMETSERAWLVISFVGRDQKYVSKDGVAELSWEIKNVGNTPARLIESDARFQVMGDDDLPDLPDYPKATPLNERMLTPGDSIRFFTKWEERKDGRYTRFVLPVDSSKILWIRGFAYVRYLNVFGNVCESRSCDSTWLNCRQFRGDFYPSIDAPAEYTKCT